MANLGLCVFICLGINPVWMHNWNSYSFWKLKYLSVANLCSLNTYRNTLNIQIRKKKYIFNEVDQFSDTGIKWSYQWSTGFLWHVRCSQSCSVCSSFCTGQCWVRNVLFKPIRSLALSVWRGSWQPGCTALGLRTAPGCQGLDHWSSPHPLGWDGCDVDEPQ